MEKYKLTNQDLLESLKYQLYIVNFYLSNFSANEILSIELAIKIIVLVHDTSKSTSLLKLLNKKEKVQFINSASPNDGRLHSMTGMTGVRGSNSNQYFGLVAKINRENKLIAVPLFQQHLTEWYNSYTNLSFEEWWEMQVVDIEGVGLSRKELVLNVTNKDGGAHIDEFLPSQYYLAKTSKLTLNVNGTEVEFEKNVVYASIAQIGWELLNSINEHLNIDL